LNRAKPFSRYLARVPVGWLLLTQGFLMAVRPRKALRQKELRENFKNAAYRSNGGYIFEKKCL
jgi:hypothetical protein